MRHLADIRKRDMGIVAGVFPPYGRSKYWIVATASYAPLADARARRPTPGAQGSRETLSPGACPLQQMVFQELMMSCQGPSH